MGICEPTPGQMIAECETTPSAASVWQRQAKRLSDTAYVLWGSGNVPVREDERKEYLNRVSAIIDASEYLRQLAESKKS